LDAGWNIGTTGYTTYGVTLTLRPEPYTSNFEGMPTRTAYGKDTNDAIQKFLKQLEEESDDGAPARAVTP